MVRKYGDDFGYCPRVHLGVIQVTKQGRKFVTGVARFMPRAAMVFGMVGAPA